MERFGARAEERRGQKPLHLHAQVITECVVWINIHPNKSVILFQPLNMVFLSPRGIIKRAGPASTPPPRTRAGGSLWPPPPHLSMSWTTTPFTGILPDTRPRSGLTVSQTTSKTAEDPAHAPALSPPSPPRWIAVIKGLQMRALKAPTCKQPL